MEIWHSDRRLRLTPVYDMLPMLYAPVRGIELPARQFAPALPMPAEQTLWRKAARAALAFWQRAAEDVRITTGFERTCLDNAQVVQSLTNNPDVRSRYRVKMGRPGL